MVRDGISQGKTLREIASSIRPVIGLNDKQAGAVSALVRRLEEGGLTQEAIDRQFASYVNKAYGSRAAAIARTETSAALNEGMRIGYDEAGITKLMRVEDPDCCERFCAEHQGEVYSIEEASGVLPAHPNCEGTWVAAV